MSKERDFVYKAYYEGGSEALKKFVGENLKYPKEAKDKGIQGTVKLSFDVDYKGKVHHVKVLSGIGFGCDEEAIRIVMLLEYKVPKTYKLKVGFKKKLNIHFRLKKLSSNPNTSNQVSYNYTITSTDSKSSDFNYTVRIK